MTKIKNPCTLWKVAMHSPPLKQSSTNGKQGLSVDQWERRSTARKLIQPLLVQVTALHSCKMSLKPHFRHFRIVILIILVNKYSFISMQLSTMHHKIPHNSIKFYEILCNTTTIPKVNPKLTPTILQNPVWPLKLYQI